MSENKITSEKSFLRLGENPLDVESFFYLPKSTNVCPHGKQSLILRISERVSEPILLTEVKNINQKQNFVSFNLEDATSDFKAVISISSNDDGIKFHCKVEGNRPIWLIEWKLSGLKLNEVLVPALGGQSIKNNAPVGTLLSYKYPFWWNAQFVLGSASDYGIIIRSKEEKPELKLLRVLKEQDSFEITYGFEVPAPLDKKCFEAEWYLDFYEGNWKNGADIHRNWLEKAFQLKPFKQHSNFPEWADKINFVLEIWGARRDRINPAHSFDEMRERINDFAKLYDPRKTLLYLAGFAEHGIDSNAPDYNPSSQCGGEEKFKLLVDEAHRLGYKVMIHTNVLAMTFHHRLYPEFKKFQVIDCFGREQTWGLDMDGDWLAEPYFAYINPANTEWGDLMKKTLGDLINKFNLDAVFLDQTLLAFNVSNGKNFLKGMRDHIQRLQKAFPGILFAGEGINEQVLPALPMAQIHGIDSITEVHGMEGRVAWREVHPISVYLFGKFTKLIPHLLTKHPSHPMFAFQERSYEHLGVLPALVLYTSDQPIDIPETRAMIIRSETLKNFKDLK
jgi:hypothetical protein